MESLQDENLTTSARTTEHDDPASRAGRSAHSGRPRARSSDRAGRRQTQRGMRAKVGDVPGRPVFVPRGRGRRRRATSRPHGPGRFPFHADQGSGHRAEDNRKPTRPGRFQKARPRTMSVSYYGRRQADLARAPGNLVRLLGSGAIRGRRADPRPARRTGTRPRCRSGDPRSLPSLSSSRCAEAGPVGLLGLTHKRVNHGTASEMSPPAPEGRNLSGLAPHYS
jgi:hypothetical protein